MTRNDYLKQLDKHLKKLPQQDYQEAMDYFTEYFDEAGPENEAQVIQELCSTLHHSSPGKSVKICELKIGGFLRFFRENSVSLCNENSKNDITHGTASPASSIP